MSRNLFNATLLLSSALLLGRLSGMVRELIIGNKLGATEDTDAVLLILTLPDLLIGLILSGGFSAVLVPAFRRASPAQRVAQARKTALYSLAIGLFLAATIAIFTSPVLGFLAQTLNYENLPSFGFAFQISLLTVPLAALIGCVTAYLHSVGKFSVAAVSVVVFNLVIAVYVALMTMPVGYMAFAICLLAAMAIRMFVQLAQVPEVFSAEAEKTQFDDGILRRFMQAVFANGLIVAVPLLYRSLHSAGGEGYLSQFNFAIRLYELPNAIFVAPLVSIFLPFLTDAYSKDRQQFEKSHEEALEIAFGVSLVAALIGAANAYPITLLLFGYGGMTESSLNQIATLLSVLLLSLPFAAIFQISAAALYAQSNTRQVMANSGMALIVSLAVYYVLTYLDLSEMSAAISILAFNAFAAFFNLFVLFRLRLIVKLVSRFGWHAAKLSIVMTPFLIVMWNMDAPKFWVSMVFTLAQTIALLAVSSKLVFRLKAMRLAKAETAS